LAVLAFFRRTSFISPAIFLIAAARRPSATEMLRALTPFRTSFASWRFSESDQSFGFAVRFFTKEGVSVGCVLIRTAAHTVELRSENDGNYVVGQLP